MARLEPKPPISASSQFAAVAFLRWRLWANGFRRKGGKGELIARIIIFPFGLALVVGPMLGAGFGAYAAVDNGHPAALTLIFWAIFLLQIVVSINISPPGLNFDPESLIRFPLSFPRYLTVRLFLGLLSVSTIVGTMALLAAAFGASLADHSLIPVAFAAALALAATNMLFTRMVFAWVDRWLSTRRAREAFTGLIILASVGFQYLNVTFNNFGGRDDPGAQERKIDSAKHFYHAAQPTLSHLPPGLAAAAILQSSAGHPVAAVLLLLAVLLFGAAFLAVFAWRMQREYRGENLSEANNSPAAAPSTPTPLRAPLPVASPQDPARQSFLSPVIRACLEKEFIYLRRNTTQFYGLLLPLAMVFLFAGRMNHFARTGYVFPAAIAYSFMGLAVLGYNAFGLDTAGIQGYFLAPIQIRSVLFAKNLFSFAVTALQIVLVYLLLVFTSGRPPFIMTLTTLAWVAFATFSNTALGNIRSITTPKKVDPSKLSRKQQSQLSSLMSVGLTLVLAGIGVGLMLLGRFFDLPWLPIPVLLALAAGAAALYFAGLNRVDAMAYTHRESMLEELCKAS